MLELVEILMGGLDPAAAEPLNAVELKALQRDLPAGENLQALLRGRAVGGSKPTLWVLTTHQLLVLGAGQTRPRQLPLSALQGLTLQTGRFGCNAALQATPLLPTLYAADSGLAALFAQALQARGVAVDTAGSSPRESARLDAVRVLAASQAAWRPSLHDGAVEVAVMLREMATLHERGLLNDSDFATLKNRLLQAA